VLDSFEVGDVASTATGALVGTSVGCVCSSLDWLVVVAANANLLSSESRHFTYFSCLDEKR
jgi:hypothetical protein